MLAACIQGWSALIDTQLVKFIRGTQLIRLVAVSVVISHRYEVQPHMAAMVFFLQDGRVWKSADLHLRKRFAVTRQICTA